jgi:hypothetical protein
MTESDNDKAPDFRVRFTTNDPISLLLQQIVELRAEVGALAAIVMGEAADRKDPIEIAGRFERVRKELLLRFAFELQDTSAQTPEE